MLLRCGAIPEPTYLWWDARLQPKLGTLEIRIMDAQSRLEDVGALVALAQCAVRLEADVEARAQGAAARPEVLNENRFLAVRDGMGADFVDPDHDRLRPGARACSTSCSTRARRPPTRSAARPSSRERPRAAADSGACASG